MDARIVKTRRRLQEALFSLARERGVDEISVSDIAARAAVNRSTFYQHYSDKETLLADALDLVAEESGANLDCLDLEADQPPEVLVAFLLHVEAYADLYHRVFNEPGYGAVLARLRAHVGDAVRGVAERPELLPGSAREVPIDVVADGITGMVVGVIGAWLRMEPRPPAGDAALWMWRIVLGLPAIRGAALPSV